MPLECRQTPVALSRAQAGRPDLHAEERKVVDSSLEIELLLDARASTGENPIWSEKDQSLYWIDIEEPALHRFDILSGVDQSWETPSEIGAFALCEGGGMVVALRTGLAMIGVGAGAFEHLCAPRYNPLKHRFNDGKCDALGRFWVGTMFDPLNGQAQSPSARPVSVFTAEAGLKEEAPSAVIANGLAWSPDSRRMYFTDSHARTIWAFDFDLESARIGSGQVFAQFDAAQGTPDGAAVDEEGFYWCALYGGGKILRFSPEGRIDRVIAMPVSQPTMCAFGGSDYSTLYVTSAAHGAESEPGAGGVFGCRPGVRGRPTSLFAEG